MNRHSRIVIVKVLCCCQIEWRNACNVPYDRIVMNSVGECLYREICFKRKTNKECRRNNQERNTRDHGDLLRLLKIVYQSTAVCYVNLFKNSNVKSPISRHFLTFLCVNHFMKNPIHKNPSLR